MILTRSLDRGLVGEEAGQLLLRPLEHSDAAALAAAYRRNREHLAPWEPTGLMSSSPLQASRR